MNDTNIEHQAVNSLIQIKREQKTRTGNERVGFVIVYDFIFILHSNWLLCSAWVSIKMKNHIEHIKNDNHYHTVSDFFPSFVDAVAFDVCGFIHITYSTLYSAASMIISTEIPAEQVALQTLRKRWEEFNVLLYVRRLPCFWCQGFTFSGFILHTTHTHTYSLLFKQCKTSQKLMDTERNSERLFHEYSRLSQKHYFCVEDCSIMYHWWFFKRTKILFTSLVKGVSYPSTIGLCVIL